MYAKIGTVLILTAALIGASGIVTADEEGKTQTVDYIGSNYGVGAAYCGLIGLELASACFEVTGTENLTIEIDDDLSGTNVWLSARILADSGNVDLDGGCGTLQTDDIPEDAHTVFVWIYGAGETSIMCDAGAGGVSGTMSATFH